jgi:hypothetical protein
MKTRTAWTSPPGRSPAAAPLRGWMDQSRIAFFIKKDPAPLCGGLCPGDSTLIRVAEKSSAWTKSWRCGVPAEDTATWTSFFIKKAEDFDIVECTTPLRGHLHPLCGRRDADDKVEPSGHRTAARRTLSRRFDFDPSIRAAEQRLDFVPAEKSRRDSGGRHSLVRTPTLRMHPPGHRTARTLSRRRTSPLRGSKSNRRDKVLRTAVRGLFL